MVIVTTAVYWGLNSQLRSQRLLTGPLNLPAPGRRQSIYINLTSSHGPVFLINSRFPLFSATPQHSNRTGSSRHRAPLLPKLRGHFAEFLNHSSPERLSIFNLTTCVGLGYGRTRHLAHEAFLDSTGSLTHPQPWAPHHASTFTPSGFTYQTVHTLSPGQPSPGMSYLTASLRSLPTT